MFTLGARVKQARLELGMSQQQLAGEELSRSFICRIERGRVSPSLETLKLLAERLGKPLTFFSSDLGDEKRLSSALTVLLTEARQALRDNRLSAAISAARGASRICWEIGSPGLELEIKLLLLNAYDKACNDDVLTELAEELLDWAPANTPAPLTEIYLRLGNALYRQGDLLAAKRQYCRGLKLTQGRKSLQELAIRLLINLGSCCYRMGEFAEAESSYRQALYQCDRGVTLELVGLARLGLGWVMYKQGNISEGHAFTDKALSVLQELGHPAAVHAKHNKVIIMAGSNDGTGDLGQLEKILEEYQQQGDVLLQASILEEIACYFMRRSNFIAAEQAYLQAVARISQQHDTFLLARLYRLAAEIYGGIGNLQRAQDYAEFSLHLFRKLQSSVEVQATEQILGAVTTAVNDG